MTDKLDELNALIEKARGRGMIPRGGSSKLREGLLRRAGREVKRYRDGAPTGALQQLGRLGRAQAYLEGRRSRRTRVGLYKSAAEIEKAKPKTLYVYRAVENADDILKWAKEAGFKSLVSADNMHVTVCWSKTPLNWARLGDDWTCEPIKRTAEDDYRMEACAVSYSTGGNKVKRISGGPREVKALGDKGAVVLAFQSVSLTERWAQFIRLGASNKFPGYTPHITLTFDGKGVDLTKIEPFTGDILLGEEEWAECDENWKDKVTETVVTKTVLNDLSARLDAVEKAQAKPEAA